MLLFGSGRLQKLEEKVSQSFARVREDADVLFQWVHYLNAQQEQTRRAMEQFQQIADKKIENAVNQVRHSAKLLPVQTLSVEDVKRVVEQHLQALPVDSLLHRMKVLEQNLLQVEQKPKPTIRERLVQKISRHGKEYIKGVIISFIRKYDRISALKLREIVVEEQALCSKSSFYRILEELEHRENLNVVVEGKEKVFMAAREVEHERK